MEYLLVTGFEGDTFEFRVQMFSGTSSMDREDVSRRDASDLVDTTDWFGLLFNLKVLGCYNGGNDEKPIKLPCRLRQRNALFLGDFVRHANHLT